jgi:predicted phage terminase large subunit-like protein
VTLLEAPPDRVLVPRLEDGTVDLESELAMAILDQAERVFAMPSGPNRDAEECDLVYVMGEVGWWELWLQSLAPGYVSGFSTYQRQFWNWLVRLDEKRPRPLVACWPRGGGKTTSVQLALLYLACYRMRNYGIYVGLAQSAVEDKVAAVGELLVSNAVGSIYPEVSQMYETGTGTKRDWRRSRIRTNSDFTLDAFGMDQGMRGVKVDEMRPGIIVLDDIEEYVDTPYMTQKRIDVLTRSIIPAAATNAVIFYIQNKIHSDSIMARMLDGRADFLGDRLMVGPIPQIEDLVTETYEDEQGLTRHRIVSGTPTWPDVLGIEVSNQQLLDEGLAAFLSEKQHDTDSIEGTMFRREMWKYIDRHQLPSDLILRRGWDLAATEDGGDYTVGVLMAQSRTTGDLFIIDVRRGQWGSAKVEQTVSDTADEDGEDFGGPFLRQAIEDQPGAAGKAWRRRWQREILAGHPHDLVPPKGSKTYRAEAYAAAQQRGQIHLVRADWNAAFVREHAQFDVEGAASHDDQVDAGSLAFNQLILAPKRRSRARSAASRQVG